MVVTKTPYTNAPKALTYFSLSGTAAEVLQALADEGVHPSRVVMIKSDATLAVYSTAGGGNR